MSEPYVIIADTSALNSSLMVFLLDRAGIPWGTDGTGSSVQVKVPSSRAGEARQVILTAGDPL